MLVRNLWLQISTTFYSNGNKVASYTVTAKRELACVITICTYAILTVCILPLALICWLPMTVAAYIDHSTCQLHTDRLQEQ